MTSKRFFSAMTFTTLRFCIVRRTLPIWPGIGWFFHVRPGVWRMPLAGGEETELPELRAVVNHRYWTAANSGIYFLDSDHTVLKRYDFATRRVQPVATGLPPMVALCRGLVVSPDERSFLWARPGPSMFQILMVEGFR